MIINTSEVYKIIVQYGDSEPITHSVQWTGCVRFNEVKGAEEFLMECLCGECPDHEKHLVLTADELATLSDGRVTRIDVQ